MGNTWNVSTPEGTPGLRERKKNDTRLAIRREAFRLSEEQGFVNTTVEQIAEAADVSPRTFYRYFSTKESVLICNEVEPIIQALADAPSDLSPVAAYRHAVKAYFRSLTDDEREDSMVGQQLLYTVPEARGLLYSEYTKLIDLMADALAIRAQASVDPVEHRVIAGAIVGVLIAASDNTPFPEHVLMRSLEILDTKIFGSHLVSEHEL